MVQPPAADDGSRPQTRLVRGLSADDIEILDALHPTTRRVRRNRDIVTEGRSYETLFAFWRAVTAFCVMAAAKY
jgi:hypothetical protein